MAKQPKYDPSANVIALVDKETTRGNDLREALVRLIQSELARIDEKQQLNIEHAKELRQAESARINAILDAIIKGAESDGKNADTKAEALALLLQSFKTELSAQITELRVSNSNNAGKGSGVQSLWSTIVMLLLAAAAVISTILLLLKK